MLHIELIIFLGKTNKMKKVKTIKRKPNESEIDIKIYQKNQQISMKIQYYVETYFYKQNYSVTMQE